MWLPFDQKWIDEVLFLIDYMQKAPETELIGILKTAYSQLILSQMHLVNYLTPFR
jgi:hypothetical protein